MLILGQFRWARSHRDPLGLFKNFMRRLPLFGYFMHLVALFGYFMGLVALFKLLYVPVAHSAVFKDPFSSKCVNWPQVKKMQNSLIDFHKKRRKIYPSIMEKISQNLTISRTKKRGGDFTQQLQEKTSRVLSKRRGV